jgi:hypothetical protein
VCPVRERQLGLLGRGDARTADPGEQLSAPIAHQPRPCPAGQEGDDHQAADSKTEEAQHTRSVSGVPAVD